MGPKNNVHYTAIVPKFLQKLQPQEPPEELQERTIGSEDDEREDELPQVVVPKSGAIKEYSADEIRALQKQAVGNDLTEDFLFSSFLIMAVKGSTDSPLAAAPTVSKRSVPETIGNRSAAAKSQLKRPRQEIGGSKAQSKADAKKLSFSDDL